MTDYFALFLTPALPLRYPAGAVLLRVSDSENGPGDDWHGRTLFLATNPLLTTKPHIQVPLDTVPKSTSGRPALLLSHFSAAGDGGVRACPFVPLPAGATIQPTGEGERQSV